MRSFFIILILVLETPLSFAQTLDGLRHRLKLLQNQADFVYDTTGFSKLPRIEYKCDNNNKGPSDYFHVVDLNNDGRMDVIYSGPCGDVVQTGIFLNTGRVLKKVYDNVGKIVGLQQTASKTTINILKEACCCDFFSQYTEIILNEKSEIARNTIVFGAPTKISLAGRFKEDKVMGTIRTTPAVNDVIKRDECNNTVKGNQLTRIHDFKDVIQINKAGAWWLVLYPETSERSWIGWMKLE